MVVKYNSQEYECARAIKGKDYVLLFDADGNGIAQISRITDFSQFTVINGVFELPEHSTEDYLVDLDYRLSKLELGI